MIIFKKRYFWIYAAVGLAVAVSLFFYIRSVISSSQSDINDRLIDSVLEIASREDSDANYAKRFRELKGSEVADTTLYASIRNYAQDMMLEGRQADVFELLSGVIRICEENVDEPKCRTFVLDSYVLIGAASDEIGMFNISNEYYARGVKLASEHNDQRSLARLYNNLGVCYFHMDDMEKAEEFFTKAMHLNKRLNYSYDLFLNFNNLSEVALQRNELDEALDNALLALQYLDAVDGKVKVARGQVYYIQSQIANIYLKKKDWNMARSYIDNSTRQFRKSGPKTDLFQSCMIYSDLHRQTGELDSALTWCSEAYDVIKGQGNLLLESQALSKLSELEREKGDYPVSLNYLEQSFSLRDSLQQAENRKRMEQSQRVWETERMNLGKTSFLARQNPVTVFIVFSVIVLVLIFFIVRWALENRKLSATLKAKEELDAKMAAMHEEQLAEAARKQNELKQSLDLSHRQLTAFTMQKIKFSEQQNDVLEDIRKLFAESASRPKELQSGLQRVISKLSGYKANDDWTEFRYYFENVNTDFYSRLAKAHPDLTEKQKRLCALLYLGLNTKEIAQITFREIRSIESSRTRLRKKLGLSGDEDLNVYFRRFANDYDDAERQEAEPVDKQGLWGGEDEPDTDAGDA